VAGGRWQAEWIFAPLAGRQGHPGATVRLLYHLLGGRWVLGALGVGCWVLGVGCPEAATTRSPDRGTSRGVSLRRSEAPLTLASRSVEVIFWFGRWVLLRALGVGRWVLRALGARQGHPRGVGCLGGRRRGHFTGTSMARLKAPIEHTTTV